MGKLEDKANLIYNSDWRILKELKNITGHLTYDSKKNKF